ncbi:MAG: flippase activity-associated protein Agl23 [Haloferacaceae archaeon]
MRPPRLRDVDRTAIGLCVVSTLALAIRLFDLGGRVFHWDEGRVGYWTLRYADSGIFEYDPIIHGPFLPLVNSTLFEYLGATDAVARLVVAVVGGLLPLLAWLFRDHLDDLEVIAVGVLLAFNPVLVYYGRFMRNDVLVAGFSAFALGFAVRALATRDVRRLYPAAALVALAFTTKGNALLYLACYAGATALILDHLLVRARDRGRSVRGTVWAWITTGWGTLRRTAAGSGPRIAADGGRSAGGRSDGEPTHDGRSDRGTVATRRRTVGWLALHLAGLAATFLAVVVWFYAPRPDIWAAFAEPTTASTVLREATVGSGRELVDLWLSGNMQEHDYMAYAAGLASTMTHAAAVVSVFAIVGMAVDTFDGRNRLFVAFCFYWGLASLVGYPAATDIEAGWTATHVIVPLSVPAGVGLAHVTRQFAGGIDWAGLRARLRGDTDRIVAGDPVAVALAGLLLLSVAAGLALPTATYWNSTDRDHTELVQYAQPHGDLRESIDDVEAVVATHDDGADVLFVGTDHPSRGSTFYVENESKNLQQPAGSGWYDRLPLPWYLERSGADVTSSPPDADPADVAEGAPPVVIAWEDDRPDLEPHLDGYVAREHEARLWGFRIVVFVEEDALAAAGRPVRS